MASCKDRAQSPAEGWVLHENIPKGNVSANCFCRCRVQGFSRSQPLRVCVPGYEATAGEIADLPTFQNATFCVRDHPSPLCDRVETECGKVCSAIDTLADVTTKHNNRGCRATCDSGLFKANGEFEENVVAGSVAIDDTCELGCPTRICDADSIEWKSSEMFPRFDEIDPDSIKACTIFAPQDTCSNDDQTPTICTIDAVYRGPGDPCGVDAQCGPGTTCTDKTCRVDTSSSASIAALTSRQSRSATIGGVLRFFEPRSDFELVPPASKLLVQVDDRTIAVPVHGQVQLAGTPLCPTCEYRLDATLRPDPHSNIHGIAFDDFAATLHTTEPFSLDADGIGVIPAGQVMATVDGLVDEAVGGRVARTRSDLHVSVDWRAGTIEISDGFELLPGVIVSTALHGLAQNRPPLARIAGDDIDLECSKHGGSPVTLDASASFDLDDDALQYLWRRGNLTASVFADDATTEALAPLGASTYRVGVLDAFGQIGWASRSVTVHDTVPPTLSDFAYRGPLCLWPPRHDYVVLRADRDFSAVVTDRCDPSPRLVLTRGMSNEADDGVGDGSTTDDVVVFPDHVCIRTERQGMVLGGRSYDLSLAATDASGNRTDPTIRIRVPHDQRPDTRCAAHLPGVEFASADDPSCDPALAAAAMRAASAAPSSNRDTPENRALSADGEATANAGPACAVARHGGQHCPWQDLTLAMAALLFPTILRRRIRCDG